MFDPSKTSGKISLLLAVAALCCCCVIICCCYRRRGDDEEEDEEEDTPKEGGLANTDELKKDTVAVEMETVNSERHESVQSAGLAGLAPGVAAPALLGHMAKAEVQVNVAPHQVELDESFESDDGDAI